MIRLEADVAESKHAWLWLLPLRPRLHVSSGNCVFCHCRFWKLMCLHGDVSGTKSIYMEMQDTQNAAVLVAKATSWCCFRNAPLQMFKKVLFLLGSRVNGRPKCIKLCHFDFNMLSCKWGLSLVIYLENQPIGGTGLLPVVVSKEPKLWVPPWQQLFMESSP